MTGFQSMSSTGSFSEAVSGLNPNTTYVVLAEVEDSDGNVDFGQELEFTTADDLNVDTNPSTDVKDTSATLNGDLTGLGGADSVAVRFRYWEKGNKGNTYTMTGFQSMSSTGSFSEAVSGLNPNTTYVVLAEVEDPNGNVDFGQKLEFTTADDLDVTTESASNVGSSSATLNGKLTSMQGENSVDVRFRYWEKGNKGNTYTMTGFRSMSSTGSFSESVSNLTSGTTYVFVAEAETQDGETDIGQEREFSTT
jgi:subtilisin